VYLNSLYNPAPQGNWPHSLMIFMPVISKLATYLETALGLILRSYYDVLEIYLASYYTR
jgi:hypothetical protein